MSVRQDGREYVFNPGAREGDSPLSEVLGLMNRKWTRAIIEQLLVHDGLRYNELRDNIDGISDKVLSEMLEDLEQKQLVTREVIDDRPVRVEYSLTEAGAALDEVMCAVTDWADMYLEHVEDDA